jgi:hypothetical protein
LPTLLKVMYVRAFHLFLIYFFVLVFTKTFLIW